MKIIWTKHSEKKLREYQLAKSRILKIIKNPYRIEEGVAPQTIALMKPNKFKKINNKKIWRQEIWAMIQKTKDGLKIISVWRYPGQSPAENPIPQEIIMELKKEGFI